MKNVRSSSNQKRLLDGRPFTIKEIIYTAKEYGYDWKSKDVSHSEVVAAMKFLQENGHTIVLNPEHKHLPKYYSLQTKQ